MKKYVDRKHHSHCGIFDIQSTSLSISDIGSFTTSNLVSTTVIVAAASTLVVGCVSVYDDCCALMSIIFPTGTVAQIHKS